jgi:hypothetical protein
MSDWKKPDGSVEKVAAYADLNNDKTWLCLPATVGLCSSILWMW